MLTNTKCAISLAEIELGAKRSLIGNEFPVAVNLTGIFNTELKRLLIGHKNVTDVHLCDGELGLGTLTLASEVQGETLLVTGDISEGCARVMVWTLWTEGHAASHLCVGPDFSFERLNLEYLILEEHLVLLHSLSDAHVLAVKSGHSPLLSSLELSLRLSGVIGVITV